MSSVYIHILNESVINPFMEMADMTERGRKVFCNVIKMRYQLLNEGNEERSVSLILNTRQLGGVINPIKPVFALSTSDNRFVGVYWRNYINQIGNGRQFALFHQFVSRCLWQYQPIIELNENVTIRDVYLHINNEKIKIQNLNNDINY